VDSLSWRKLEEECTDQCFQKIASIVRLEIRIRSENVSLRSGQVQRGEYAYIETIASEGKNLRNIHCQKSPQKYFIRRPAVVKQIDGVLTRNTRCLENCTCKFDSDHRRITELTITKEQSRYRCAHFEST
jgi:hypothetical protein